jgi:hypothetical protein
MRADRSAITYLLAGVVGLVAAVFVLWQLDSSASTNCVRRSVRLPIDARLASVPADHILPGCPPDPFDAVRGYVHEQATLARDPTFVPDQPDEVKGLSALLVWMALFASTAAVAGISAVLSISTIAELDRIWDLPGKTIWTSGVLAIALIALPFVLLRLAPAKLSPFDDLHHAQLLWMPPLVALLTVPAATGLFVIRRIVVWRTDFGLSELVRLGSLMRNLISMLGAILSLSVLGTASRWQMIAELPGGEGISSTLVLLWGAAFAAVLAAIYVPVYDRWAAAAANAVSAEVREQFSAYEGPGTVGYRPPELAARKELQATLGLGGALRTLQGSFAVLAPVIAAAVGSLFS